MSEQGIGQGDLFNALKSFEQLRDLDPAMPDSLTTSVSGVKPALHAAVIRCARIQQGL